MAETFKVGANARELLRYTQRATRIVIKSHANIVEKAAEAEKAADADTFRRHPQHRGWCRRAGGWPRGGC